MVDKLIAGRMDYALGCYRKATGRQRAKMTEVGKAVAKLLKRKYVASQVSRHFTGERKMDLVTVAAYATVMRVDSGWLAFGALSDAPAPGDWTPSASEEEWAEKLSAAGKNSLAEAAEEASHDVGGRRA